jgi:hypothetical protein
MAMCKPAMKIENIIDETSVKAYWNDVEQKTSQVNTGMQPEADEAVDVSSSITQSWTDQALKCYLSKSDCANCSIPRGEYSFQCQMNKVVPALLHQLGTPDLRRKEHIVYQLDQY